MDPMGIEPTTLGMQSRRSPWLSYRPRINIAWRGEDSNLRCFQRCLIYSQVESPLSDLAKRKVEESNLRTQMRGSGLATRPLTTRATFQWARQDSNLQPPRP